MENEFNMFVFISSKKFPIPTLETPITIFDGDGISAHGPFIFLLDALE
jgi:hypothetical protein